MAPLERLPGSELKQLLLFALVIPAYRYWNWRWENRWYECEACHRRVEPPAWYTAPLEESTAAPASAGAATGFRCPSCGTTEAPRTRSRGSSALHVLLYFTWVLPGIVYGWWRRRERRLACRRCGADLGPAPATP